MTVLQRTPPRLAALAALGLVAVASACARVKPEDLDARLSELRGEMTQQMQQGDQSVAADVTRLETRVDGVERRVDALARDLDALEQELGVTVERLETALRFHVPVYFDFDEAELDADARATLDRFGEVTEEYYPQALVTVEGFADPAGPAEYNRRLGLRRAEAAKAHLVGEGGLAAERVRTVSYGENTARLVVSGAAGPGPAARPNRRVVLVIDHNGAPPAGIVSQGAGGRLPG